MSHKYSNKVLMAWKERSPHWIRTIFGNLVLLVIHVFFSLSFLNVVINSILR